MQNFINFLSAVLLKAFNVRLNVSCMSFYGEPDCSEEILK